MAVTKGFDILMSVRIQCEILVSYIDHVFHDYIISSKPYESKSSEFMKQLDDLKHLINKFFAEEEIVSYIERKKFTHHFITKLSEERFAKILNKPNIQVLYRLP